MRRAYIEREVLIVIGIILIIISILALAFRHDNQVRQAACREMMSLARTASDSINVIAACQLPVKSNTVAVPYYMPMPR